MLSHYYVIVGTLWSTTRWSRCTTYSVKLMAVRILQQRGEISNGAFWKLMIHVPLLYMWFCMGYGTSRDHQNVSSKGCNTYCCLTLYICTKKRNVIIFCTILAMEVGSYLEVWNITPTRKNLFPINCVLFVYKRGSRWLHEGQCTKSNSHLLQVAVLRSKDAKQNQRCMQLQTFKIEFILSNPY